GLRSERGHHLAPDGHGGARPGQARRAVVVVADPHDAQPVSRESGKPGVALLVGGAGLSGDRELGRQEILQPLRRALAHDVLHGRGQEVHRLGRECLLDRERIALQRSAFLRGDFADRAQWRAPAAARDRLVHLRHLEGTQVGRAEQGRGERLHLALDAEPAHVGEHALDAELGAQARRGDVRSEEHTSELQSRFDLVCRLLLDPAPTGLYTLSLHDALPIYGARQPPLAIVWYICATSRGLRSVAPSRAEANGCTSRSTPSRRTLASTRSMPSSVPRRAVATLDRKSTRLNSSHVSISYAVFCLTPPPPGSTLFPYTTLFRSMARASRRSRSSGTSAPPRGDSGRSRRAGPRRTAAPRARRRAGARWRARARCRARCPGAPWRRCRTAPAPPAAVPRRGTSCRNSPAPSPERRGFSRRRGRRRSA